MESADRAIKVVGAGQVDQIRKQMLDTDGPTLLRRKAEPRGDDGGDRG
jgi:hypothetical protein